MISFGAFAFRTKAETSNENRRLQQQTHEAERCEDRNFHVTPSCVHPPERDQRLPEAIRGGHYLHFRHFCTVLGCEHAPYGEVCNCFANLGELIIPFPILCKDTNLRIEEIIQSDPLMSQREYAINNVSIFSLLAIYNENADNLIGLFIQKVYQVPMDEKRREQILSYGLQAMYHGRGESER